MQFVPRNFIITKVWQIARQASQTCMYRSNAQLPKKKEKKGKSNARWNVRLSDERHSLSSSSNILLH